jgi:tetratricopeptide (TPR) repeat protein
MILSSLVLIIAIFIGCNKKTKIFPVTSSDFSKAKAMHSTKNDSAFYYFNRVVNDLGDSLEVASAYHYMAWIQSDAGDYFGSQESVLLSQQYLNEKKGSDQYWIALNYDILGTTSLNLKQYDKALFYYELALKSDPNPANYSYYLNNKAVAYQKKKKYGEAIVIYQSILDQKPDSITEYARVLSNLAKSKWLKDSSYPAAAELWTALNIRRTKNDDWGLNASYAHLSDYYSKTWTDSALFYSKQMYDVATMLNSPDDELEALDKLIKLEQPAKATKYFNHYIQLNDSLQQARNAAKNQFALIRFDAEKSKADNLLLQKDNIQKRTSINRQRFILFSVLFVFASLVIIATLWYKKRKQRFILESQNAIKEQQLKTSKKVHDVVANGLYQVMTEIEHKEIEKEKLLDRIEVLYEKSRDISYETPSQGTGSYEDKINELLSSFSSTSVKVLIAGNNDNFWKDISIQTKKELKNVLQELMINMKKHSRAKNVVLKFDRSHDHYHIKYTDDGTGMAKDVKHGNGLKNTGNRITAIDGTINFEPGTGKGVRIDISFSK